jgi:hypothetical protein
MLVLDGAGRRLVSLPFASVTDLRASIDGR